MPVASSKSSSPSKKSQKQQENNCKVYVSNVHRDTKDQQLRELFQKFGKITYFNIKRKPNDVVYSFIQFESPIAAQQAILKTNRMMYNGRPLNVQFGRGGKHQQQHYQALKLVTLKNSQNEYRQHADNSRKYQRRASSPQYHRRTGQPYRPSDRQYRRSISPPSGYIRKDYKRDFQSKQYDSKYPVDRFNDRDVKRRIDDDRFHKQRLQKRYSPEKYSPRRQKEGKYRRQYDDIRPQNVRKYDDKRQQYDRKKDRYGGYPSNMQKNDKYYNQRDDQKKYRKRYDDQYDRQKYRQDRNIRGKIESPYHERYDKAPRLQERKTTTSRPYDKLNRYPDNRQRPRDDEYKRSRSRDKSLQKHQPYRRYENDDNRGKIRQQKQYSPMGRGRRSPEDRERRFSRVQYKDQRNQGPQYRKYYPKDDYRKENYQRSKYSQGADIYRKQSKLARSSSSSSPVRKIPNKFSSQRDSPKKGAMDIQSQNKK